LPCLSLTTLLVVSSIFTPLLAYPRVNESINNKTVDKITFKNLRQFIVYFFLNSHIAIYLLTVSMLNEISPSLFRDYEVIIRKMLFNYRGGEYLLICAVINMYAFVFIALY